MIVCVDRLVVGVHWLADVLRALALAGVIAAVVLATHAILRPSQ